MRTIIWFLYFWLSLILLVPSMLRAQFLTSRRKWEKRDRMVNSRVRWWMGSLLRLAGVEVTVSGLENIPNCPAVFVSNHQGNFDIPILLCNLDRVHGIVAKIELQKIPFIRIWMRYFNCVFIDRNNPRRSMAALNQAIRNIQEGGSMIIFPEGTRSRNDEVGEFKAGGFKIAQKTGAPIVPVCIGGSYKAMEAIHTVSYSYFRSCQRFVQYLFFKQGLDQGTENHFRFCLNDRATGDDTQRISIARCSVPNAVERYLNSTHDNRISWIMEYQDDLPSSKAKKHGLSLLPFWQFRHNSRYPFL